MFVLFDPGELPELASPAESDAPERQRVFSRLLDALSANDRTAFVLRSIEGLSHEEIVQATGSSLATVKRRVHRASQKIAVLAKTHPELVRFAVRRAADPRA